MSFYLQNFYKLFFYFCLNISLILFFHFFISWVDYYFFFSNVLLNFIDGLNIIYLLSLDNISLIFLLLTSFLLIICVLLNWFLIYKEFLFYVVLVLAWIILLNIFMVNDLLLFFFFFESIVIPMFLLIGLWGGRKRRIKAAYMLLMYTLVGSIFSLFTFLFIYYSTGSTNFVFLTGINLYIINQNILFFFCFFGFSVKIPIVPLHLWLPEAHVEAPTIGSILLAGILLKLSFYAFLRVIFFLIDGWVIFLLFSIFLIGFYLPSLAAMVQLDIKKIIAYSSVSHMNFGMFGLFSKNLIGLLGSFFLMVAHAIVASALFLSIGILYERYKTRVIFYYSALFFLMPLWSVAFFLFILANFGLPCTINFVGEFIILLSVLNVNFLVILFLFVGLLLTLGYSLFLYNRMAHGTINSMFIRYYNDISRREFILLINFVIFVIFFGIFPQILIKYFFTVNYYLFCLI